MTSLACAIDSLSLSVPDIESLRLYLTLPMYHEFKNTTNATILQVPYAEALLNLKNSELDTLGKYKVINSFVYLSYHL